MKGFDARCMACGEVYVLWLPWSQDEGDTVKYAHTDGLRACGEYAEHELVAALDGLDHMDKWGPDDAETA